MKEVNIWDLERVHIKPTDFLIGKINKRILLKFNSKIAFYKNCKLNKQIPFSTFKDSLKLSHLKNYFVPLNIYLKITSLLGISKETLQNNILAYKTARGVNVIEKPILPVKISPIFHMLLAHHFGDGFVTNPKNGRLPYLGYKQFNEFYRISYIKKIEFIFGKINYRKNYLFKSMQVYCPAVLSSLFFKFYNLNLEDFLTEKARIPDLIFQENDNMLAVLVAFIIDEGNIDSTQITIHLKNGGLIEDLDRICKSLLYHTKITLGKKESHNYVRLHILREGMKKFYQDYLLLNKKYPVIDLGIKGEKIKNSFNIYARKHYKTKGNKNVILNILKKEELTVNQLAERLNMTRQGIRFHIHNLLNEGKIKILDKNQLNWIYGV